MSRPKLRLVPPLDDRADAEEPTCESGATAPDTQAETVEEIATTAVPPQPRDHRWAPTEATVLVTAPAGVLTGLAGHELGWPGVLAGCAAAVVAAAATGWPRRTTRQHVPLPHPRSGGGAR